MKRFLIEDLADVASLMYESIVDVGLKDVMFVGHYDDAVTVVKKLLMYDETIPYHITIEPEDSNEYDREYYVTLDEYMNIWCEEAYDFENERYLYTVTEYLFVADDCNSALLKEVGCDKDNIYEVSYDLGNEESDCECDGNCACCGLAENEDEHEVVTRVAVDDTGKLRGFEKSWSTKEGNMTYHSTYTHYSNNTELLKQLMEDFDIKL